MIGFPRRERRLTLRGVVFVVAVVYDMGIETEEAREARGEEFGV